MTELQRRTAMMGESPITDEANPVKVSERDSKLFFYEPVQLHFFSNSERLHTLKRLSTAIHHYQARRTRP
jgi:hypothetical protein